jgi:EAL domain-containing protein (putative c-di-GMP-specific phosphodiesterase class I)
VEIDVYVDAVQRVDFAQELAMALDRHEMRVKYQPIVRLGDGAVVAFEALARWTHPRFGAVPPDRFIPVAEASGAIVPIGRWVLRTALQDFTRMKAECEGALRINVNTSPVQLLEPAFAYDVGAALDMCGVRGEQLVLEVTEGALIDETSIARQQLYDLHELSVRIAIDDFGTGYSSLAYLQRLPVEELKIDRSFVDGIDNGRPEGATARAIVRMCDSMGLRCLAQGVERESQIAPLLDAG